MRANFRMLLRLAALGRLGVPLPLGTATARRAFVGIRNLCDLLATLTERGSGVFHVSDNEDVSVADLLRRLGVRERSLVPVSATLAKNVLQLLGARVHYERLFEPLTVDVRATREQLDWTPPFSLDEELQETAQWFRNRRRAP